MDYNRFELPVLQNFAEEYNRLAEYIVLFDKDAMEEIDYEERLLLDQVLLGKSRYSKRDIELKYRVKRVKLIAKMLDENKALRKVQKELSQYVRFHKIERARLQLAFGDGVTLSPTEIYVNYEYLVKELEKIKKILDAYQRK